MPSSHALMALQIEFGWQYFSLDKRFENSRGEGLPE
jgi:hypothetical protein